MEYRVEELARRGDVAVDTVRYYQARGLLNPPRRVGRIAWYDDSHLRRLQRIRSLATQGLTLATIGRLISGQLDAADQALATAVAAAPPEELLGIEDLAQRTGIPVAVLQAVAREGILIPRHQEDGQWFTAADVEAAKAGLDLLQAGLPLSDVLDLARRHHAAVRAVAERAVVLFDDHVRQPLRSSGLPEEEVAARLVEAFQRLLPATVALVTHHFRRTLLAVATEHIEQVGGAAELAAIRAEEQAWVG